MRFDLNGQEDPLEGFQQPLSRGPGCGTLGIARIQFGQGSDLLSQVTTQDELYQCQDAQGDRQQTHLPRNMIIALNIQRREQQKMSFQAPEGALHQILIAVVLNHLRQGKLLCRKLRGHRRQKPPSFGLGASNAKGLSGDGLKPLVASRNTLGSPIRLSSLDLDKRLIAGPQNTYLLGQQSSRNLQRRQWTQVTIAMGLDTCSRGQRFHLVMADRPQTGLVQGIIGLLSCQDNGSQGQRQRIQRRQHYFELGQVRLMILVVPLLQQPVLAYRTETAGDRTVQADRVGMLIIHTHQLSRQFLLELLSARIGAQVSQHICRSIITEVAHLQRGIATAPQHFQTLFYSGLRAIYTMIGTPVHMCQPYTVAMHREVPILQLNQAHALHLGQQERDFIDPLGLDRQLYSFQQLVSKL